MKRSENIGTIAGALSMAQAEMGAAQFDRENPHFRSKYATLASVFEAIKPIHKHGLALFQSATVSRSEGSVLVEIETTLAHKSGEWISEAIAMKPGQDTPQAIGSAITYGRRYLASALCGIAADEDDDGNDASGKQAPKQQPKPRAENKMPAGQKNNSESKNPEVQEPTISKTETAQTSVSDVAAKIKRARSALMAKGIKTPDDFKAAVMNIIGREVAGLTDLSSEELDQVIAVVGETA